MRLVPFVMLLLCFNTYAQDKPLNLNFVQKETQVAPGLLHTHYQSPKTADKEPLSIHTLTVDLQKIEIRPALAMDQIIGQETTSSMAHRYKALAGVNGGFSYSNNPWVRFHGDPRGFLVLDGQILSEPNDSAWSVGIHTPPHERQHLRLVRPHLQITFQSENTTLTCTGLNRERKDNDCIVYTPIWNPTTLTSPNGVEVVVANGQITHIQNATPNATIPTNGFVISATGDQAEQLKKLKIGSKATFTLTCTDLETGKPLPLTNHHYVSAGPKLIQNGQPVAQYIGHHWFHKPPFTHQRHPRTAIGWHKDGNTALLITVDGRQPEHSMGMTLPELSAFFIEQGIHTAYNMDGGGSTAMAVGDSVVNKYSDVFMERNLERRRCDALLLFSRK